MADYRYLAHDADIGVEVEAADLAGIWDASARALVGLMTDPSTIRTSVGVPVEVIAQDAVSAWVESLTELLVRFDIDGLLLPAVTSFVAAEGAGEFRVSFVARGEPLDLDRHPVGTGIKAVTHHGALLGLEADGSWRGRLLLDL